MQLRDQQANSQQILDRDGALMLLNEGISVENGVHPSNRVQRLVESIPRSTEAVHITKTFFN